MKWPVIAVRTFVGLIFVVFGLNMFLRFIDLPLPPEPAYTFIGLLISSKYLYAVKALEIIGGVMLLSGRLVPLGVTMLTPIGVNILFYEVYLLNQPGPGHVLVPLLAFLVYGYRSHFAPVFAVNAKIG
ncbi:MAG: uncharacterized protein JWO38_7139 [Gemmataceae bacterium]|nr:uncharacterized protein [Gemmataceae bacterium]